MKTTFLVLLFGLMQIASSSQLQLTSVTQPLYLHGSDVDTEISITAVPYLAFGSEPEWRFAAISAPFIPPTGGPKPASDINLVSLYHIKISGTYTKDGKNMLVTIDASEAVQPKDYPFTIEQVIEAATTCVRIMYPERPLNEGSLKIEITRPKQK